MSISFCSNDFSPSELESFDEDEFFNDGFRRLTVEESIIYNRQIAESDGFDVDPLPKLSVCGYIRPGSCNGEAVYWANFAIDRNNTSQGVKLQFDKVVKYTYQICCLCTHYITFTATDTTTGVTKTYQTRVYTKLPLKKSVVEIFREKNVQQYDEADTVRFLTIFAISHYNMTKGEDIRLINVLTFDQRDDSLTITFKATDLSTCMIEFYRTEVVSRDPMVESTVIYFTKLPDPYVYQDENSEEESKAASIRSGLEKMKFGSRGSHEGQGSERKELGE